jgi:hypothetical protein
LSGSGLLMFWIFITKAVRKSRWSCAVTNAASAGWVGRGYRPPTCRLTADSSVHLDPRPADEPLLVARLCERKAEQRRQAEDHCDSKQPYRGHVSLSSSWSATVRPDHGCPRNTARVTLSGRDMVTFSVHTSEKEPVDVP